MPAPRTSRTVLSHVSRSLRAHRTPVSRNLSQADEHYVNFGPSDGALVDPTRQDTVHYEWDRHLPDAIKQRMPPFTKDEHDRLLDGYLRYAAPWHLRVVGSRFLLEMRISLSDTGSPDSLPHYSGALHNAVLTEAVSFASGKFRWLASPSVRVLFLERAAATAASGSVEAQLLAHAMIAHCTLALDDRPEHATPHVSEGLRLATSELLAPH